MTKVEYGRWKSQTRWLIGCIEEELFKMGSTHPDYHEAKRTKFALAKMLAESARWRLDKQSEPA